MRGHSVAEGFGNVWHRDRGGAVEVSDRASDLEHAEVRAGGEAESVGGGDEEIAGGGVDGGFAVEPAAGDLGVGCDTEEVAVACGLARACRVDAGADGGGRFAECAGTDGVGGDGADADVHIDAVGEGAGETGGVAVDVGGEAGADRVGFAGAAARARVHRGDEGEPGGVGDGRGGAGEHNRAIFERLTETVEDLARELEQFVQKEHAQVRERDLAWAGWRAA